jgi:hypothetical protein
MVTPAVTEIRRNGNPVGKPVELARRPIPAAGKPMRYGRRPDGFMRTTLLPAGPPAPRLGGV